MRACVYCTRSNARRVLLIIFGFVFFFRLPMFFFSEAQLRTSFNMTTENNVTHYIPSQRVVIVKKYEEYQKIYFLISITLFEIIPFFLLSTLNVSIICMLKKSNRKLDSLIQASHSSSSSNFIRPKGSLKKQESTQSEEYEPVMRFQSGDPQRSRSKSFSFSSVRARRKQDEIKLTRQLVGLITLVVMSEICSIITYEKITAYLFGSFFPGYMESPYKLQVVISNNVILCVHSVNFLLLCAFNSRYFKIFKENYSFVFKHFTNKSMKRDLSRQLS